MDVDDKSNAIRGRVHAVVRRHRETKHSSLTPLQHIQLRVAGRRANPALRPKHRRPLVADSFFPRQRPVLI
jgi:hypothetical protein